MRMSNSGKQRRLAGRVVLAMVSLVTGAAAGAQDLTPSRIEVSKLGPQVGELVPEFSLPDQNGKLWTRDSIMGANGAMLVFIRSADW